MDIGAKHAPPDENGVRIAALDERSYRQTLWSHRPLTDFWRVGRGYARKLEAKGLVTRKVNSKNKREKIVCATPEATSVFDEMRASFVELDNTLFSGFTPEEKVSACDLIARMAANLQEVVAAPPVSAATTGDAPAAASASPTDAATTGKERL